MTTTLALITLFLIDIIILLVILAFARQLGLLLVRLGPTTALPVGAQGPDVGDQIDEFAGLDLMGREYELTHSKPGVLRLLLMIAPTCPACATLKDALPTLAKAYKDSLRILVVSATKNTPNDYEWARELDYPMIQYISDPSIHQVLLISQTPYAILIDEDNRIVSKGIVNTLEQVESLLWVETFQVRTVKTHGSEAAPLEVAT